MSLSLIEFVTNRSQYTVGQSVTSNCNSITFFNTGTNTMVVDGVNFAPQTSIVFQGNVGEITNQNFNLSFTGAGTSLVTVYRKVYIKL
jgi:hypothetical protein